MTFITKNGDVEVDYQGYCDYSEETAGLLIDITEEQYNKVKDEVYSYLKDLILSMCVFFTSDYNLRLCFYRLCDVQYRYQDTVENHRGVKQSESIGDYSYSLSADSIKTLNITTLNLQEIRGRVIKTYARVCEGVL